MGYSLLEAWPGGCPCCSPTTEPQSSRRRLISAQENSISSRSIVTQASASTPAEAPAAVTAAAEGPEALKEYVDRRIQLFEHFKLRESDAVRICPANMRRNILFHVPRAHMILPGAMPTPDGHASVAASWPAPFRRALSACQLRSEVISTSLGCKQIWLHRSEGRAMHLDVP